MVLCCRRGVDFSMASVRARSASTRERTWSRSEDDIFCCCFVLAFLCFFDFVRFFLLNEYTSLSSSSSSQSQVISNIIASPSINELRSDSYLPVCHGEQGCGCWVGIQVGDEAIMML